jgi:Mrp family chromosome partitioning ATPase
MSLINDNLPDDLALERTMVMDAVKESRPDASGADVPAVVGDENLPSSEKALYVLPQESLERIQIAVERTDRQFSQLYAALEWQMIELSKGPLKAAMEEVRSFNSEYDPAAALERSVVFGVSSALRGEGKTTVAMHLALTIARNSYKKVCLMDLSLGDDEICRRIGAQAEKGIVSVLEGEDFTIRTLQLSECGDLSIMPAGKLPTNATRAARSPSVGEIIAAARRMFDVIIVDLPSISTGNALPIAAHLDKTLLVVHAGVTPKDVVTDAIDRVGKDRTMGVVLNRIRPAAPSWIQRRFARV